VSRELLPPVILKFAGWCSAFAEGLFIALEFVEGTGACGGRSIGLLRKLSARLAKGLFLRKLRPFAGAETLRLFEG
jgi:hypothetical protein